MEIDQLLHDPDQAGAGDRRPELDRQALPIFFVDDSEAAEEVPSVESVVLEVEGQLTN